MSSARGTYIVPRLNLGDNSMNHSVKAYPLEHGDHAQQRGVEQVHWVRAFVPKWSLLKVGDKSIEEILEIVNGLIRVIFLWGNVWMRLYDKA